ncbi:MAG: outer membrane beta-barrel protein [Pseudomonadota bacterium]
MIKKIISASLIAATALTTCVVIADEEMPSSDGIYIQLDAGTSLGRAPNSDFGKNKVGSSGLYGGEIGYQFNEYLRMGLGVDYRNQYSFSVTDSVPPGTANTPWKVNSLAIMANFYYDITNNNGFIPYVVFGAGMAQNTVKDTIQTTSGGKSTLIPGKKTNDFAYKAGLGVRYEISKNILAGLQYQYIDLGKIKSGTDANNTTANTGKLRANEFLAVFTYKF